MENGTSEDVFPTQNWHIPLLLLMAEILHQLRLVVYPIVYRVSAPSQVVVWDFSRQTVCSFTRGHLTLPGCWHTTPRWHPWASPPDTILVKTCTA